MSTATKRKTAIELRDEALERVEKNAGHEWKAKAFEVFANLPTGTEFTGEGLRILCEAQDIIPHHHNAWGAFMMGLKRNGLIFGTGQYRGMRTAKSHARKTEVYRKV